MNDSFIRRAALVSAGVGILAIVAWLAHWPMLARVKPEAPCMVLDSALGILHAALGLWLAQRRERVGLRIVAGLLVLAGGVNLFVRRPEIALHFYVFPNSESAPWSTPPQMASGSAAAFVLLGSGLLLLAGRKPSLLMFRSAALLGTMAASFGAITLLAYAAGLHTAPWWSETFLFRVSIPTAFCLCMLGTALVAFFWQEARVHPHQLSVTLATLAVLCALLIFGAADAAAWASLSSMLAIREEVRGVLNEIAEVEAVDRNMRQAESGQRGYLLTEDEGYLAVFASARERLQEAFRAGGVRDGALLGSARRKLEEMRRTIAFEKEGRRGEALALVKTQEGERLMRQIDERSEVLIAELRAQQARRLDERLRSIATVRSSILWSLGMAVGLGFWAIRLAYAEIGRRAEVEASLEAANEKLREQTARAEEANQAKSGFLAAMSHEIRTPMSAILGMAEVLSESPLSPTQRHYVAVFRRAGNHLLNLINGILDLAKVEAGSLVLETIPFRMREPLEAVVEMLEPKAEAKGIRLAARLRPEVPSHVLGDPARLQQVLFNLVGNAVKFTNAGEVTLTVAPVRERAGALRFEVADTGIGIAAEQLPHIFDDYKQAEASTSRRFGGTGLGLGISRRLVRLMGGEIEARSELGRGSTFWFEVVLPAAAVEAHEIPAPAAGGRGGRGRHKILVAEDSEDNRFLLQTYCQESDYELTFAGDGQEAVEAYQAGRFETVVMDIQMPVMDGLTAAGQIRGIEAKRGLGRVPILALTASALQEDVEKSVEAGCDAHLAKPISKQAFLSALAAWGG